MSKNSTKKIKIIKVPFEKLSPEEKSKFKARRTDNTDNTNNSRIDLLLDTLVPLTSNK